MTRSLARHALPAAVFSGSDTVAGSGAPAATAARAALHAERAQPGVARLRSAAPAAGPAAQSAAAVGGRRGRSAGRPSCARAPTGRLHAGQCRATAALL